MRRAALIRVLWDVAYADGELHELEDNTLWRVAELIGVDRRDRIAMRQEAARRRPDAKARRATSSMKDRPKILIVLHQETSSPGRVGQLLAEKGFDLDIRRPPLGDHLPDTLEGHAGTVVFGGPMSANDDDEAIKRETDWLKVPLTEKKPFLGICLGAPDAVQSSRGLG
jgi:DnaJ-domain-containing protein 1